MASLHDKVVVVTGASSGIGEATARAFGAEGCRVVVAARRLDRLQAVATDLEAAGGEALAVVADLSRLDDIRSLADRSLERFGRIDILFNNAGVGRIDWLENLDPEKDIAAQFAINVLGVIQTTRQILPVMIRQTAGHIINMASMAGLVAAPSYTVYAACKFAVRGFSEALRREAAPWGIRVSVVYPGGTATEFGAHAGIKRKTKATTPKWLVLQPADVAQAVVGLARRPRSSLVLPWPLAFGALANQLFPRLVDAATVRGFTIPERIEELKAAGLR